MVYNIGRFEQINKRITLTNGNETAGYSKANPRCRGTKGRRGKGKRDREKAKFSLSHKELRHDGLQHVRRIERRTNNLRADSAAGKPYNVGIKSEVER
jgi:hypothetical protein